jgi:hypothetical protein
MGKEWLWWLGEFGLAATVAVVAGFVTRDVPISILYGLFVGTVFFVLREFRRVIAQFGGEVADIEDKALKLPVILSHLEDVDPFLKQQVRLIKDELFRLAKGATDGEFIFHARPLQYIAIDFVKLARPGDKLLATNSGVGWGTPIQDIVRQVNFELAEKGVDFTRVFIEPTNATAEDKKRIQQEMERQKGHFHIRWVKEAKLPQEARPNMVLIYDKYVAYATWSKPVGSGIKQIMDEIRIYARSDELKKAEEIAETIIKLSEEYK